MKKIISLVLVCLIFFGTLSLASCDSTNDGDESKSVVSGTVLHFGNSGQESGSGTSSSSATSLNTESSSLAYNEYLLFCNNLNNATRYKMFHSIDGKLQCLYENDGENKYVSVYDGYENCIKEKWIYNGVGYLNEIGGEFSSGVSLNNVAFLLDFTEIEDMKAGMSVPFSKSELKNLYFEDCQNDLKELSFEVEATSNFKGRFHISYGDTFSFVVINIAALDYNSNVIRENTYEIWRINDTSFSVSAP